MAGCSWQEKSFSVAVSSAKADSACAECRREIQAQYKHNGDVLCKECFGKLKRIGCSPFGIFHTNKDLSYQFTTDMFGGKPVDIHSRRQFRTLLKQHGLADASIKEAKQQAEFRKRVNSESDAVNRRKTAERIMSTNRDRLKFRRK